MRIVHFGSGRLSLRAKLIIGLMFGLSVALLSLMALLAIGMLLFLLPIAVLGAAIYAFLPKRKTVRQRPGEPYVLEGQYRVVDPKDPDRLPRD
jgi:predicted lipid-binding transport protein (Tim44 family)